MLSILNVLFIIQLSISNSIIGFFTIIKKRIYFAHTISNIIFFSNTLSLIYHFNNLYIYIITILITTIWYYIITNIQLVSSILTLSNSLLIGISYVIISTSHQYINNISSLISASIIDIHINTNELIIISTSNILMLMISIPLYFNELQPQYTRLIYRLIILFQYLFIVLLTITIIELAKYNGILIASSILIMPYIISEYITKSYIYQLIISTLIIIFNYTISNILSNYIEYPIHIFMLLIYLITYLLLNLKKKNE